MRRSIHSYIATPILFILLLACHSKTDTATARTNPDFGDDSKIFTSNSLVYADTTTPENQRIIKELDAYYATQRRYGFNGSVLVGSKGKVIYERYFGYSNHEKRLPLTPYSSCQLASVSKTFTSAAILFLYQRKYLDINDEVSVYLPDFPYKGVTIKTLLDHRSGLPEYTHWIPNYIKDTRTPITNKQVYDLMVKYKPHIEFRPNTRYRYRNMNYAILALIIEKVTAMNYRDFMQHYIFEPLGMNHTFVYNPAKGLPVNAAISYKYNWRREPDMFADGVYGDKGIYSTVEDLYRWDQSFYQNKLLNNKTIEMAYGPCSFERPGIKNYGLGWHMLCYPDGNKVIYHNGWWHGNNTSFYRFIGENLTIIVLGNKFTNSIYHQAPKVYSIVENKPITNGFDIGDD